MEAWLEKSKKTAEAAIDVVSAAIPTASQLPDLPAEKPKKSSKKQKKAKESKPPKPPKPPSKFLLSLIDGWKERFCGSPRKAPVAGQEVKIAWKLNEMRKAVAAAKRRLEVAAALAGYTKLVESVSESGDYAALFRTNHKIIQGYVARLGFGVKRKREGAVKPGGENKEAARVKGYALGFGSAALCGSVPIPSYVYKRLEPGESGDLAAFVGPDYIEGAIPSSNSAVAVPTGMSGMAEFVFCGPDERLRPPLLSSEYAAPVSVVENAGISRRGMILCGGSKCLRCATERASREDAALTVALEQQVFQGASYGFGTFTLRHFHKDPARQLYALRCIYALFIKNAKRIFERYGCVIALRKLEMTMDSLLENKGHGAHPHYHVIFIFFKKTYDKKGKEIIHANINVNQLKDEIKYLWYKCIKDFYDLVPGDEGKTEKYKDDILEHGFNMAMYDDVFCDTEEKRKESKERLLDLRKQWDSGNYDLPENIKKFLSDINEEWKDDKDHFIKQLAGVTKASNYCSGVGKWDIGKEMTGGTLKTGQNKNKVNYFTWLLQAALIDDPYIDSLASDLICSLNRVRFTTSVKGFLDVDAKDDFYKKENSTKETRGELKEYVHWQKTRGLPQVLSGDRVRIDALIFGDRRYKAISNVGFEAFNEKIQKSACAAVRSLRGKDLDIELAKKVYDTEVAKVESEAVEPSVNAPRVPAYMLESQCWEPASQNLLPQRRKYIEILKLLRRFRRDFFLELCRRLAPDSAAPAGFSVERMREIVDPDRYDPAAEKVILAVWPEFRKKLLAVSERERYHLWVYESECEREQREEEKKAISEVLALAGFYGDRRFPFLRHFSSVHEEKIFSWLKSARYEDIWDDFYGHFEIRNSSGALVEIEGKERVGAALFVLKYGIKLPFGAGGVWEGVLKNVFSDHEFSGWWGVGFNSDLFENPAASAILDAFDFSSLCDDSVAMGKEGSRFAGCRLVHVPGKMAVLLADIEEERKAVVARALADFSARLALVAREAGWRKKDLQAVPDLTIDLQYGIKVRTVDGLRRYFEFGVRYGLDPSDFKEILAADPRAGKKKKVLQARFHPYHPSTWLLPVGVNARDWIKPYDPQLDFSMPEV